MYIVRRKAFEQMVAEVLDTIPEELAALINNVAVFVEDDDPDEGLMGYYDGLSIEERAGGDYSGHMPDRIVIFRLPHCRSADTEEEVRAEVRTTVLHEIAHFFGISDEELHRMDRY